MPNETHQAPSWEVSEEAARAALPELKFAARPIRSGDADVYTPEATNAKADLDRLYRLYPLLRPKQKN